MNGMYGFLAMVISITSRVCGGMEKELMQLVL